MTEPVWLDEYSGQTVDELISLESTHRIDSLVLALEEAIDQKAFVSRKTPCITADLWILIPLSILLFMHALVCYAFFWQKVFS